MTNYSISPTALPLRGSLCAPADKSISHRAAIFAALADGDTPLRPLVVLSHLTVPGIDPGEETNEMPRGAERVLPIAAIASERPCALPWMSETMPRIMVRWRCWLRRRAVRYARRNEADK